MEKGAQCTVHLCKSIKLSVLDSARTFFFTISTDTLCLMIKLKLGKLTYYGIHMSGFSNSPDRFCWAKISLDHYHNKAVLDKKNNNFSFNSDILEQMYFRFEFSNFRSMCIV